MIEHFMICSPAPGLLARIWGGSAFVLDKWEVSSVVPMHSVVLWTGDSLDSWEKLKGDPRYHRTSLSHVCNHLLGTIPNQEWHRPTLQNFGRIDPRPPTNTHTPQPLSPPHSFYVALSLQTHTLCVTWGAAWQCGNMTTSGYQKSLYNNYASKCSHRHLSSKHRPAWCFYHKYEQSLKMLCNYYFLFKYSYIIRESRALQNKRVGTFHSSS